MMRNGKYAKYNGKEYELSRDMDGNLIIITDNVRLVDKTFEDIYNTGVYSRIVEDVDLSEVYRVDSYVIIDGMKLSIRKETDSGYIIGTNDYGVAQKLNFERVDKYGYEKYIDKKGLEIIEEKIRI